MKKIAIVSAKRTPIGKINGQLQSLTAVELGTIVTKAILQDTGIEPDQVDQVIFGNVIQAGAGQNVARQIELNSGVPQTSTACTINQVCGSGMKAVRMGQTAIQVGDCEVAIVGGTESMSNAPYLNRQVRSGHQFGGFQLEDSIESDGLNDANSHQPMGTTAEAVAEQFHVSRAEQDQFALRSHQQAAQATADESFKAEVVPITIQKKKTTVTITTDETIRPDTSLTQLQKLRPAFASTGTVTAGNAASLNDGASALLLMSVDKAQALGLTPLAILDDYTEAGCNPAIMGYAPYYAVQKLFQKTGTTINDFDLVELNEAFASQSVAVARDLNIPHEKLNVTGGAIALGHPLGDSGARILTTLIHNLHRTKQRRGLATLCIGGGMAMAYSLHLPESRS
ncbi:thiolase family protein [Fructilactobacillus myrtifloralis]|uniref:acetyl-CoA C-acetyltransferase n=1 Tax=Fructilactobacillus myrtifloralis TaxID=2940301 RepID=A0ABY5BQ87_9LACO|nr:thiolase family protein [Fructilactobacillus myrtifloralis]USS84579.1 thiolase family protein [Fructilactobacillus myrtifloralis]